MRREAARTLRSLTPAYQRGVAPGDWEVVAVDNGSTEPLSREWVESLAPGFRHVYHATRSPSPVAALNAAARQTRGAMVGLVIDGARLLSPGVLLYVLQARRLDDDPLVLTLGWHLGPDVQQRTVGRGYTRETEDALLARIGWPAAGYRLFEVSALAVGSAGGFFGPIAESNCLFMTRQTFERLGGFDERFDLPGGGLANHDLYGRAMALPDVRPIVLLGEGTFHQVHGGVMTNEPAAGRRAELGRTFARQYEEIRGHTYARPTRPVEYLGAMPPQALRFLRPAAATSLRPGAQGVPGIRRVLARLRRASPGGRGPGP
jgi:hypothetical protein